MLLSELFQRGALPLLEKVVEFTEQRQKVLAHNIANIDTPFYKTHDLDTAGFQQMLRRAVDARRDSGSREIAFRQGTNLRLDAGGALVAKPVTLRHTNVLFHDQNNRNAEQEMAELAKNTMLHNLAATLLKGQFETLKTAIRGRL